MTVTGQARPGYRAAAAGIPGTRRALPGEEQAGTEQRQNQPWLPGFQPPQAAGGC